MFYGWKVFELDWKGEKLVMSEDVVISGTWYIPQTNETLNGALTINKENKVIALQLTALASEDDPMANIKAHGRTDIIKGEISTGGKIVLYDCSFRGPHTVLGQKTDVIVTAKYAFWNLDVKDAADIRFSKVSIDFGEIIDWTELCYFNWEPFEYQLKWIKKEKVVFKIREDLTLEIMPRLGSQRMYVTEKEMTVQQKIRMDLEYKESQEWEIIAEDIRTLNSLLALAMNRAVYIEEIYYEHESNMDDDLGFVREMEIFIGDFRKGKHKSGKWYEYLFQLKDLTSNDNICFRKWYEKYERLQPIVDLYGSSYNFKGISREMLFLNLAQALETYHARFISNDYKEYENLVDKKLRELFVISEDEELSGDAVRFKSIMIAQNGKRAITLKSRLGYLFLGDMKVCFEFLNYPIEEFIQKTLDSRNYYTHYSMEKQDKVFPKEELPYVNGILIAILQYYILKEIGINEEKILEKIGQTMGNVVTAYEMNI